MENNNNINYNGEQMPPSPYPQPIPQSPSPQQPPPTPKTPEELAKGKKRAKTSLVWGILSIVFSFFGLVLGLIAIFVHSSAKKLNPNIKSAGEICGIVGAVLSIFTFPITAFFSIGPIMHLQAENNLNDACQNAKLLYDEAQILCDEAADEGASISAVIVFDTRKYFEYESYFYFTDSDSDLHSDSPDVYPEYNFVTNSDEFKNRIEENCNFKEIIGKKDYNKNAKWMVYIENNRVISTVFADYGEGDIMPVDDYFSHTIVDGESIEDYVGAFVGSYPQRQSVEKYANLVTTRWLFTTRTLKTYAPNYEDKIMD
jgi:hypothetical protein